MLELSLRTLAVGNSVAEPAPHILGERIGGYHIERKRQEYQEQRHDRVSAVKDVSHRTEDHPIGSDQGVAHLQTCGRNLAAPVVKGIVYLLEDIVEDSYIPVESFPAARFFTPVSSPLLIAFPLQRTLPSNCIGEL
jgi:hypothetical protein